MSQNMPEWYDKKDFNTIEHYIREEAERFVDAYQRTKLSFLKSDSNKKFGSDDTQKSSSTY